MTKRKRKPKRGWSPAGQDNQHDKGEILEGKEKEGKRSDERVDEYPYHSPSLVSTDDVSDEPLIVEDEVEGYLVIRVYVDGGASMEVMFEHCFENPSPTIKARMKETQTYLVGFAREATKPLGKIELEEGGNRDEGSQCNGRRASKPSVSKAIDCYKRRTPQGVRISIETHVKEKHGRVRLGTCKHDRSSLEDHRTQFECQCIYQASISKQMVLSPEKSNAVARDVDEWAKADIVRPVKYPTWISNPVLVKKCDGAWRMCIDFKNLNSACPKDYYPLPNIDCKVESVMGFKYKCFLDAYKSYHQIQMSKEDEDKTVFYTDQGIYYYTNMPFGLKNARATYQRLIDLTSSRRSEGIWRHTWMTW
ncbi:hypothetical protein Tco_1501516 [Tanacetum coccineum]